MSEDTTVTGTIEGFSGPSKQASFKLPSGKVLDVVVTAFADKIMVMVYSDGRLGKMYYVPLLGSPVGEGLPHSSAIFDPPSTDYDELEDDDHNDSLLPLPHLTPMPLVGGSSSYDLSDVQSRIYAAQIASVVARQAPQERRQVVVGLAADLGHAGGKGADFGAAEVVTQEQRREFLEIIRLVQLCRVW